MCEENPASLGACRCICLLSMMHPWMHDAAVALKASSWASAGLQLIQLAVCILTHCSHVVGQKVLQTEQEARKRVEQELAVSRANAAVAEKTIASLTAPQQSLKEDKPWQIPCEGKFTVRPQHALTFPLSANWSTTPAGMAIKDHYVNSLCVCSGSSLASQASAMHIRTACTQSSLRWADTSGKSLCPKQVCSALAPRAPVMEQEMTACDSQCPNAGTSCCFPEVARRIPQAAMREGRACRCTLHFLTASKHRGAGCSMWISR